MVKAAPTDVIDRTKGAPRSRVSRFITGCLVLLVGVFLFFGVGAAAWDALSLGYLATKGTVFDAWAVLNIISVLLSLTAISSAGFFLFRRRPGLALACSLLALPTHFAIEGSRCDTVAGCRLMGWAALPSSAFDWSVRIRPVSDPNDASGIASKALLKSGSGDTPFKTKRFADHWLVSAINEDGWPGRHAVRIDTRTARAELVACPEDRIRCGMERPLVSDGGNVFRNDRLGLSAVFPTSRPVCTSRGPDDEPRGFFTMVREPDIPCDVLDGSRQMGIEVARRPAIQCGEGQPQAQSLPWRPLSPDTAKLFRRPPTLGGRTSVACELRFGDQIQVSVLAHAASHSLAGKESPGPLYEGYIVTTQDHLAEDILSFESFLRSLRIGSPSNSRTT